MSPLARTDASLRIILRPIGAPLTLGMSGLGIASLLESGLALGWLASTQTAQVGLVLIAVPFVLQLLACIFSYLARDGASGAAVGVLCTSWLAIGLVHLSSGEPTRSGAIGLLLLSAGSALLISASCIARANPLAGLVFVLAALRFVLAGIFELGAPSTWQHVSAIVGLAVCALVAYALLAFELEGQHQGANLPTFRRGTGASSPAEQADRITTEPGVRPSS